MRTAVAMVTPNLTLPLWLRGVQRAVSPVVDRWVLAVGTTDADLERWAVGLLQQLPLVNITLGRRLDDMGTPAYHQHGQILTDLLNLAELGDDQLLMLEDDLFLRCPPEEIDRLFRLLPAVGGVIGSRMAMQGDPGPPLWGDTWGDGIYPCMMFAEGAVLRRHTRMDWRSRDGGDVGHWVGVELHRAGLHQGMVTDLPQYRLTPYPGCAQPAMDAVLPWCHVGQMSGPPTWPSREYVCRGHGNEITVGAYAAALEALPPSTPCHRRMAEIVSWCVQYPDWDLPLFLRTRDFMRKMYG